MVSRHTRKWRIHTQGSKWSGFYGIGRDDFYDYFTTARLTKVAATRLDYAL